MAESLGNAYVNIVPKAPGIEGEIGKMFGGDTGEVAGKNLGSSLLSGLGKVVSVAAVGKIVKDAFEAGGALQQSFGGLDTIYADSSGMMKEFAANAATAGISMNDYAEQAVSFGASLKQAFGGDTVKSAMAADQAIMDMADNAAKMGTDITQLQTAYQGFAKQNYTMLDNLKLGYGGTKAEMERLLADAQAISGVEYNIDNLGDVYSAIHVIQGELGLTGVAASEAQTTLTGSFGSLKASWTNLMAALTTGEGLDAALSNMSTAVGAFVQNVFSMLGTIAPQIPDFIMGLVDAVIDNAPEMIASGIEIIVKLAVGLIEAIPKLIEKIPEIFAAVKQAFANVDWLSLGRDIIHGIVAGIAAFGHLIWDSLKNLVTNALNGVKSWLGIASPSTVFRDEVGAMIPAGAALGIEDGTDDVQSAIRGMADTAINGMSGITASGAAATGATRSDIDRILAAMQRWEPKVVIEADTNRIFRIVKNTNETRTKATGYNALSMAR